MIVSPFEKKLHSSLGLDSEIKYKQAPFYQQDAGETKPMRTGIMKI